jgi:hypothetical protein
MNGIQNHLQLLTGGLKCELVRSEHISLKHTTDFAILFCHSCTSAATGRVFSITNALWTNEKNRFLVETIKAVIVTKTDFEKISCGFYTLISHNPKLLKEIRSSKTYKISAQEERVTPSTLTGN